jgi:hypothetical protein
MVRIKSTGTACTYAFFSPPPEIREVVTEETTGRKSVYFCTDTRFPIGKICFTTNLIITPCSRRLMALCKAAAIDGLLLTITSNTPISPVDTFPSFIWSFPTGSTLRCTTCPRAVDSWQLEGFMPLLSDTVLPKRASRTLWATEIQNNYKSTQWCQF